MYVLYGSSYKKLKKNGPNYGVLGSVHGNPWEELGRDKPGASQRLAMLYFLILVLVH